MRKEKNKKTTTVEDVIKQADSIFIQWEKQDEYEGILSGYGKGEKGLFLSFQDGKRVGVSTVISNLVSEAKNNDEIGFGIGDTIKLEYLGQTKSKQGFRVNLFNMFVNGKQVKLQELEESDFFDALSSK